MCVDLPGQPYRIVLDRQTTSDGAKIETYTYALGKVTTKARNGEHTSVRGFTYPLGQTVSDPNAKIGSHEHSLHFMPSLYGVASTMNEYGSHRLVVLPGPQFWDMPVKRTNNPPRCYHAASCTPLYCVDCLGLKLTDLKHDACWRDLTKTRQQVGRSTRPEWLLPVPRSAVWHQQAVVRPSNALVERISGGNSAW
jgi:hypothetical protein